jgi:hypothetical protein
MSTSSNESTTTLLSIAHSFLGFLQSPADLENILKSFNLGTRSDQTQTNFENWTKAVGKLKQEDLKGFVDGSVKFLGVDGIELNRVVAGTKSELERLDFKGADVDDLTIAVAIPRVLIQKIQSLAHLGGNQPPAVFKRVDAISEKLNELSKSLTSGTSQAAISQAATSRESEPVWPLVLAIALCIIAILILKSN